MAGVIWPTASEVADLVKEGEYEKGLDALAARAAKTDFKARLTAICPGKTSKSALARVRTVNTIMKKHGVKMAILARPPKGDTSGLKWIVEEFKLSAAEKAEIDRRLAVCAPYMKKGAG